MPEIQDKRRPCATGKHEVTPDPIRHIYQCRNCPIMVEAERLAHEARSERDYVDGVRRAFIAAERDWYIRELES